MRRSRTFLCFISLQLIRTPLKYRNSSTFLRLWKSSYCTRTKTRSRSSNTQVGKKEEHPQHSLTALCCYTKHTHSMFVSVKNIKALQKHSTHTLLLCYILLLGNIQYYKAAKKSRCPFPLMLYWSIFKSNTGFLKSHYLFLSVKRQHVVLCWGGGGVTSMTSV